MQITVNGEYHDIPRGDVTYEAVVALAGHPDAKGMTVTYSWRGKSDVHRLGTLCRGEKVEGDDGMIFDACYTGNA